ncbi:MAG: hypothetical protein ABI472_16365 [Ginsengibacter sp.]
MKNIAALAGLLFLVYPAIAQNTTNSSSPAEELKAYEGTWIIFNVAANNKANIKQDTLCKTVCKWKANKLVGSQEVHENNSIMRDSCFYGYDVAKKVFTYYETDEPGANITSTSEITIEKNVWTYHHHNHSTALWQTLNIFNKKGDEITFETQRSDDDGKTWTTVRTGKEFRISKNPE